MGKGSFVCGLTRHWALCAASPAPAAQRTAASPSIPPLQVQLGDKLVLVREGKVVHVLATAHSSLFPRVAALRPLVAEADAEGTATVRSGLLQVCRKCSAAD